MKIYYHPDKDSMFIKLKPGVEAEGEVTAIDIDSEASKLVDVGRLEVEGLPVGISSPARQESKAR